MDREQGREEIRSRWEELILKLTGPAKEKVNGQISYICPLCGHGKNGDGLTINPKIKSGTELKCFGCDFAGDIISLWQRVTGADYNAALKELAGELGLTIDPYAPPERTHGPARRENAKRDNLYHDSEKGPGNGKQDADGQGQDYTDYYKECQERLTDPAAMKYLEQRGITLDAATHYGLGFDPAADPANDPGGKGESIHPAPRIIIPISKSHYIGRSIDPNTPESYKKLNNKGSRPGIFNEGVLYAGKRAVFVTESAFDAMSIYEAGGDAIGLNSTANTGKLIDLLQQRPAENGTGFIVSLDNDRNPDTAARTRAAQDGLCDGLRQLGYQSIVYNIAGNRKDANEALTVNREGFESMVEAAQERLDDLSNQEDANEALEEEANEALEELESTAASKDDLAFFFDRIQTGAYKPSETGLVWFDDLLGGGIVPQSLTVLMAPPGAGKTTLCIQIAEEIAAHKKPVIYFSLEMGREQMLAKAISYHMTKAGEQITALDILQGYKWTDKERARITKALEKYRQTQYPYIKYNPTDTGSDLEKILDYLHRTGDAAKKEGNQAPTVIVDYLQLIRADCLDNQELIKRAALKLKRYAIDYNTQVIVISATNRTANASGKITLESGRDSSNIEYSADYQLSLNYEAVDNGTVKTDDIKKVTELQRAQTRDMIIRVLKGRLITPGGFALVSFDAAGNIFYKRGSQSQNKPESKKMRRL